MTAHPRLEPLLDDLDVVYMSSPEPQRLDVIVETAGPGELPLPLWAVGSWAQAMARGLGSGATFEPGTSDARFLDPAVPTRPFPPGTPLPTRWELALEVRAVCATSLRALVEGLAGSGHPHAITRLSVFGSAQPVDRDRTIRGPALTAALRAGTGFPPRALALPFLVHEARCTTGMSARVVLRAGKTEAHAEAFADLISSWQDLVASYPRAYGPERGIMAPTAVFGHTRQTLLARLPLFDHRPGPAADLLLNGLAALHARGMAIAEADLAFV